MIKTTILTIATLTGLLLVPVGAQSVFGAEVPLSSATLLDNPTVDAKAIPDWVRNNFEWYVTGQIDEKTLLTSMNWMFDNNVMHLSEKAAQEVADLREENEKLRALVEDTDEYRSGFFKPSEIKESSQKKSEATTPTDSEVELKNLPTRVDVRGWDPVKKQPIVGDADSQLTVDSINDFVDIFNMPDPNMMICLPAVQNSEQSSCWIRVSQVHAGGTEDTPVDVRDFAQDNLDQFNTDVFNPDILNPDILDPALISEQLKALEDENESTMTEFLSLEKRYNAAEADVFDLANKLQGNLDAKMSLRQDISELRDIITNDSWPVKFSYYDENGRVISVVLSSPREAMALEEKLEQSLQTMSDMSQMMQLDLQDAMNKQAQAMQILSNIMKAQHDTLKAIINNMR